MNYTIECDHPTSVYQITADSSNKDVAQVIDGSPVNITCSSRQDVSKLRNNTFQGNYDIHGSFNITMKGEDIGRSFLSLKSLKINYPNSYNWSSSEKANVTLVKKTLVIVMTIREGVLDTFFNVLVIFLNVTIAIGMGVAAQFDVIKKVLKKPVGPCIGMVCQFAVMPMIAYCLAKFISMPSAAVALSLFACGVAPGGGGSNIFSLLLGGDINLSITMTAISNLVAFGMIPLWMLTLGQTFGDDTVSIKIPFLQMLKTLSMIMVPNVFGMFVKWKFPKVAKIIMKIIKPVAFIAILVLLGLSLGTRFDMFERLKPRYIFLGCLLPYIGYVAGGVIALLMRQSWSHVKTIAIETGIQNTQITFIILYLSLPAPDNELATVIPMASSLMTSLPLIALSILYKIYNCVKNKNEDEQKDEDIKGEKKEAADKDKDDNTAIVKKTEKDTSNENTVDVKDGRNGDWEKDGMTDVALSQSTIVAKPSLWERIKRGRSNKIGGQHGVADNGFSINEEVREGRYSVTSDHI